MRSSSGLPAGDVRTDWACVARDGSDLGRRRADYLRFLRTACTPHSDLDAAAAIFGELVNNVARHAPGPVLATVIRTRGEIVLVVEDCGPGFPAGSRFSPLPHAETGRGLAIVTALAPSLRMTRRALFGTQAVAGLPVRYAQEPPAFAAAAQTRATFECYEFETWLLRNAALLAERIQRCAVRELRMFFHAVPGDHTSPNLVPSICGLAHAIGLATPELYIRDARWIGFVATARGLDAAVVRRCWNRFFGVLALNAPSPYKDRLRAIGEAICAPPETQPHAPPVHPFGRRYSDALNRSVAESRAVVHEALAAGMSQASLYTDVLAPALRETGEAWERDAIGIAEEHLRTSATRDRIAELHPGAAGPPLRGKLLASCPPFEQHDLGLRMICNLAEADGWEAVFLGGHLPAEEVVQAALRHRPDVIALSTSISYGVNAIAPLIARLRAHAELAGVAIIVGGAPFNRFAELWRIVGADGTAPDAATAVTLLARFARATLTIPTA